MAESGVMAHPALYRPSPLIRATILEQVLGTPARIYYKYEGVSPAGSHKPNTALAQAYYCAQEGVKRITTETGAGQWGTALSYACQQFGLEDDVVQRAVELTAGFPPVPGGRALRVASK